MKLTTARLKRLIREELEKINEMDNHQNEIEAITNSVNLDPKNKKQVAAIIASHDLRPTEKIQQIVSIMKKDSPATSTDAVDKLSAMYDKLV